MIKKPNGGERNYNLGQNICGFFHFLAQFFFTTNEMELDHYHQKVSARVASRVAERLSFQKISEMLRFDGEYPAVQPKAKL